MFKIQIPKPCHEDWNTMTATQQGAFCNSCNKEVIDFTKMTDEEVQHYFVHKSAGKTCGHFRAEQIDRIRIVLPENVLLQKIAGWKKFMAVVMLVFGSMLFGCDVDTKQNEIADTTISSTMVQPKDTVKIDSLQTTVPGEPETMGAPTITTHPDIVLGEPAVVENPVPVLMGDTTLLQDTAIQEKRNPPMLLGRPLLIVTKSKKPVSDTSKCKDTGHY